VRGVETCELGFVAAQGGRQRSDKSAQLVWSIARDEKRV
jgi:hypothetical protein